MFLYIYRIFSAIRWDFSLSRIITNDYLLVLWNLAIIRILPFLNSPKNLDLSCKTDLDFWDCFGRKILSCSRRNAVKISDLSMLIQSWYLAKLFRCACPRHECEEQLPSVSYVLV